MSRVAVGIICFIAGILSSIFLISLMAASSDDDDGKEEDE